MIHLRHIPKTGGTWCCQAMRNAGIKHTRSHDPEVRLDCFQFTMVRDHNAWLKSWYISRIREGWGRIEGPSDMLRKCKADTFQGFYDNFRTRMPGAVHDIFWEYEKGADAIGTLEDYPESLVTVLSFAQQNFPDGWEDAIRKTPPVRVTRKYVT